MRTCTWCGHQLRWWKRVFRTTRAAVMNTCSDDCADLELSFTFMRLTAESEAKGYRYEIGDKGGW
jgi:hypothetical protein